MEGADRFRRGYAGSHPQTDGGYALTFMGTLPQREPYMRFGESKYGFLGRMYEMADSNPPAPETLKRLRAIIDEAFGRNSPPSATA